MRWVLLALVLCAAGCPRPCDPSSCEGCCASDGRCAGGNTRLECGEGGLACARCPSAQVCEAGACVPAPVVDAGPQASACFCPNSCCLPGGACAPTNVPETCGPSWRFCGSCEAGQRCEAGACVPGACPGCLDPLGGCQGGFTAAACGAPGSVCATCGGDELCVSGVCRKARCDLTNCRFGCCQPDNACVDTPSVAACGTQASPCVTCATGQRCVAGLCQ